MRKLLLTVLCVSFLVGCDPSEEQKLQTAQSKPMAAETSDRVKVTRLSVIEDGVAYNEKRATYLIVDSETGQEYIGVSGIGIVETGNHNCGKNCNRQDER
jgi:hypothetical protein